MCRLSGHSLKVLDEFVLRGVHVDVKRSMTEIFCTVWGVFCKRKRSVAFGEERQICFMGEMQYRGTSLISNHIPQ